MLQDCDNLTAKEDFQHQQQLSFVLAKNNMTTIVSNPIDLQDPASFGIKDGISFAFSKKTKAVKNGKKGLESKKHDELPDINRRQTYIYADRRQHICSRFYSFPHGSLYG